MTSRPQSSLGVARGDDAGAAAHAAQRGGGLQAQLPALPHDEVGYLMALEMAPEVFHRIEFWSVSRQPLDEHSPTSARDILSDQPAAVDGRSIPDDQKLPRDMTLQVFEELHDLGALDGALVDLKQTAPQSQRSNDREALPIEGLLKHGGLAHWRPGPGSGGARAQARLVNENDGAPLALGFFLMFGHSTRFQREIFFSLRSIARRVGRWQLKPSAPSNFHT